MSFPGDRAPFNCPPGRTECAVLSILLCSLDRVLASLGIGRMESSAINRRRFIAALATSPKGIGGMPGRMLALSSNGASPNTGIVWGLAPIDPQTPRLK